MKWQLNKIQYPVYNLGMGKRIGIWVQGCNLGCYGCLNKSLWKKDGGKSVPVYDLFNWVSSIKDSYDGITISGGEPFQQYEQLITFAYMIKSKTNLDLLCFSGYYLNELENLFPDKLFLKYINTLIDGRYDKNQPDNSNLKGSLNQSIYRIENEVPIIQQNIESTKKWSVKIDDNNIVYMAGIPKCNELEIISKDLKKIGIRKKFR